MEDVGIDGVDLQPCFYTMLGGAVGEPLCVGESFIAGGGLDEQRRKATQVRA